MRTLLVTLFLLALHSVQALAAQNVRDYRAGIALNGPMAELTKAYVMGLGEGFLVANLTAKERNVAFFCQPATLAVNMDNYVDILNRAIQVASMIMPEDKLNETPIALLLFQGLQKTFPCEKSKVR